MCERPLPFLHSTYGSRLDPGIKFYQGIALVGLPRTGKTTVGTALAQHQGWAFIDSDAAIAAAQKLAIPALIARDGIAAFRNLEKAWLTQTCQALNHPDHGFVVLSTGGGMPCHNGLMAQLKQHFLTVHLDLGISPWLERMHTPPHELTRRLSDAELRSLYKERASVYHQAHYTLRQRGSVQEDVYKILAMLLP